MQNAPPSNPNTTDHLAPACQPRRIPHSRRHEPPTLIKPGERPYPEVNPIKVSQGWHAQSYRGTSSFTTLLKVISASVSPVLGWECRRSSSLSVTDSWHGLLDFAPLVQSTKIRHSNIPLPQKYLPLMERIPWLQRQLLPWPRPPSAGMP
jgi:hypothetical protein